jgi:hypothetical protein
MKWSSVASSLGLRVEPETNGRQKGGRPLGWSAPRTNGVGTCALRALKNASEQPDPRRDVRRRAARRFLTEFAGEKGSGAERLQWVGSTPERRTTATGAKGVQRGRPECHYH